MSDASGKSSEKFHKDRGFPQVIVGFSSQCSKAMVVFIHVIVFHPEVFDFQPCFGVSMSIQESIIEGVEEIEPRVRVFITCIKGISLDPDKIPDEGAGYEGESEGYFALIGVQRLYPSVQAKVASQIFNEFFGFGAISFEFLG